MSEGERCAYCGEVADEFLPNPPGSRLGFSRVDPATGARVHTSDIGPCVCRTCERDLAETAAYDDTANSGCAICNRYADGFESPESYIRSFWRFAKVPGEPMMLVCFDCGAQNREFLTGRSLADVTWFTDDPELDEWSLEDDEE